MHFGPQSLRTFHVTSSTAGRRRLFQLAERPELLIHVLQANRAKQHFQLHAFAIMPDHIHLLLTPSPEVSLEKAVQFVKGGFSFQLRSKLPVWASSFNETRIVDRRQFENCVRYIHGNPVAAGVAAVPEEFPYSSAHQTATVDPMPEWFA
jgi:putative transposase